MDGQRIELLDVIRGFSLLGIFFVNMPSFHSPNLYINPMDWWNTPIDRSLNAIIDVMLQASCYPLFSLLFGYGLASIYKNSKKENLNFSLIASRRLGFLLLIGIAHVLFIWHGDILISYAIVGTISAFLLSWPAVKLLRTGIIMYVFPNVLLACQFFFLKGNNNRVSGVDEVKNSLKIYAQGTFHDITLQRIHDWQMANDSLSFLLFFTTIMPFMLIGMALAKTKFAEQQRIRKRSFFYLFIPALLLKCVPYFFGWNIMSHFIQDIFGGPLLGASYAFLLSLLLKNQYCAGIIKALAPVGRMSLSNYLFQSFASTLIFYHYGLGLYGQVSLAEGDVLVVALFIAQMLFSRYWMERHTYGPIEWIWRSVTFVKIPKWGK
ncbi:MAG: DUF418 domain-containing protein [Bacillota bacterium]|nr:DUF418 domain-containing protein [Bacillota bacterium]